MDIRTKLKGIVSEKLAESFPEEAVMKIYDIADSICDGLLESGFIAGQVHPDFRTCPNCIVFHDSPHHEKCCTCVDGSNFETIDAICSKCGNNIGGKLNE